MNLSSLDDPRLFLSKKHAQKLHRKAQVFVRWARHNPRNVLGILSPILGLVVSTVSQGNTYAYRINSVTTSHLDGPACTNPTVSLELTTLEFSDLNLEGINVQ